MPRSPELTERLEALGFERAGREWVLPGYEVVFEAELRWVKADIQGGRVFEDWELAEIGRKIERES